MFCEEETMSPSQTKPRFEHDCTSCIFMGSDDENDFWFCPRCETDMGGSVIARFSSEGSEYRSAPVSIAQRLSEHGWSDMDGKRVPGSDPAVQSYPTVKALRLAVEKGLVKR